MRYCLRLAWRNLIARPTQSAATTLIVALTIGLAMVVMQLNSGLAPVFAQLNLAVQPEDTLVTYILYLLLQEHQFLQMTANFATVIAAATLFLAVYSASGQRERLLAIMRSLGAQRSLVLMVVIFETLLLALFGAVLGRALSYTLTTAMLAQVNRAALIPLIVQYKPELELWFWLAPITLGIAAGILPATQAYKSNVVNKLFTE